MACFRLLHDDDDDDDVTGVILYVILPLRSLCVNFGDLQTTSKGSEAKYVITLKVWLCSIFVYTTHCAETAEHVAVGYEMGSIYFCTSIGNILCKINSVPKLLRVIPSLHPSFHCCFYWGVKQQYDRQSMTNWKSEMCLISYKRH